MISITAFNTLCKGFLKDFPALKSYFLTATEENTVKKLKDEKGMTLVAVMPSASGDSNNEDATADINASFLFVIEKHNPTNATEENDLDLYARTQEVIEGIKALMIERAHECNVLKYVDINSFHVDPEYRIFGGYSGWSMSFSFKTYA